MRKKFSLSILLMTAVAITFGFKEAKARLPGLHGLLDPPGLPSSPNVNVCINGYLPALPGVNVQIYGGRPHYVERGQRVYLKRKDKACRLLQPPVCSTLHHDVDGGKY